MKNVTVTVLRKQLYRDLAEEYLTDCEDIECDFFQEGDRFRYTGGAEMPEGCCPDGMRPVTFLLEAADIGPSEA